MSALKPELHDFGKLISHEIDDFPTTNTDKIQWHGKGAFANVDWNALGVTEPTNASWWGATHHHDASYASLLDSPAPDEIKADIVLLMIADNLAATSSRAVDESVRLELGEPDRHFVVHRLWNPPRDRLNPNWTPVKDKQAALELIELVRADDADAFFARYTPYLAAIPEDKTPPSVVTSLETHMRLVNKFYSLLKRHVTIRAENGKAVALEYSGIAVTTRGQAKREWQFQVAKCTFAFPQTPVRVRDLNVWLLLEQHTRDLLGSAYGEYVLFHTTDTLYLFLPIDGSLRLEELLAPYLNDGFYVELEETVQPLGNLTLVPRAWRAQVQRQIERAQSKADLLAREKQQLEQARVVLQQRIQKARGQGREQLAREIRQLDGHIQEHQRQSEALQESLERWQKHAAAAQMVRAPRESSLYAEPIALRNELDTDSICELCQLRPATKTWTTPDLLLTENLCEVCYRIRDAGERHAGLARWERELPNAYVAWVKLSLDYDWAQLHLESLFESFLDELGQSHPNLAGTAIQDAKASLRPVALLADFTRDYRALTQRVHELLRAPTGSWRGFAPNDLVELTSEYRDLFLARLARPSDSAHILDAFRRALGERFAKTLDESPIRLGMSIASVKHPFFEHWRFCQDAPEVINVQLVGRAELHVSIEQYDLLKTLPVGRNEVSTFLHRVATIEAKTHSRILAQVELLQDERKLPAELAAAVRSGRLNWRQVLNYFKLVRR